MQQTVGQRRATGATASGEGRARVTIEGVSPEIDCGRFPIKRAVGDRVVVEADAFVDGHDRLTVVLRHRREDDPAWSETPLEALPNDRWRGSFTVTELGRYRYSLVAWIDRFGSWRRDFEKRADAGQELAVDAVIGAEIVEEAAGRATGDDARSLGRFAKRLRAGGEGVAAVALDPALHATMDRHADRRFAVEYARELAVVVDPVRARFSAWYELFPRSTGAPGEHGTLRTTTDRLPYVASMGFDVLYLPPIHPIGRDHRKGPNNNPAAREGDLGSPWAIGAAEGGHTAVNPDLGTHDDFDALVAAAREHGLDVAMDLAYQCAPDHPWVAEHPDWFRKRPDGTIQYAENPPKKYQDIYPIDFESSDWAALWEELAGVVRFWIGHGVRIFRVDNPHTKSFRFWEWMIGEVKRDHPEVIFLSEAFTRPKVAYRLAKLGFTQSYTYFAWRYARWEFEQYLTELTQSEVREYFRPNFWPNTPDILTEQLQHGGRQTFLLRLVLAATLSSNYGVYGPAFELVENRPVRPGSEEYLDSEKYQIRAWDLDAPHSLRELVTRVNDVRRRHPALQRMDGLRFCETGNAHLLAYTRSVAEGDGDVVLVVANMDEHHTQSGFVELPLHELGLDEDRPYQVHDVLGDARYVWHGSHNYVELDPHVLPAHVFVVRRRIRSEQDFDYYA